MKRIIIIPITLILLLAGCGKNEHTSDSSDSVISSENSSRVQSSESEIAAKSYHQISQEEAKKMMSENDGHIIVDVRTQEEYDEGHIPYAVCIPNESITDTQPEGLPDLDQIILVYCRSGRRSKEAAQKLFDMGYTNVYEFGGIIDWKGDIVKTDEEYNMDPVAIPIVHIGDRSFVIDLESNSSAKEFFKKIKGEPLTVNMSDYGNFEKVGDLPYELPTNDEEITTKPGDIILYQGNKITIYYDENTWSFTKLGSIGNVNAEELKEVVGEGDVTVEFSVEWTE